MQRAWLLVFACVASCSRPSPAPTADASPAPTNGPRHGAVMAEVGRRFELAGKASAANRFELASFEVGELGELFAEDLPRAELPKEGASTALPAMADAFAKTDVPALAKAADSRDSAAFASAFDGAAASCNACHRASGHGFVEVPSVPGQPVPALDAIPARKP